jgi:hypothetical protein
MSENYGQFFEAVEEINFPSSGSVPDLTSLPKRNVEKEDTTIIGKVIKTLDKINNNVYESTDSLASMASSNSLANFQNESEGVGPKQIFQAVQSLTLNNYGSTNSLAASSNDLSSLQVEKKNEGNVVSNFIEVVGEFMHNHDSQQSVISPMKPSASTDSIANEEIETVFPKFC